MLIRPRFPLSNYMNVYFTRTLLNGTFYLSAKANVWSKPAEVVVIHNGFSGRHCLLKKNHPIVKLLRAVQTFYPVAVLAEDVGMYASMFG